MIRSRLSKFHVLLTSLGKGAVVTTAVFGLTAGSGCGKDKPTETTTSEDQSKASTDDDAVGDKDQASDAKGQADDAKDAKESPEGAKMQRIGESAKRSDLSKSKKARAEAGALTRKITPGKAKAGKPASGSKGPRPLTAKERMIAERAKKRGEVAVVPSKKSERGQAAEKAAPVAKPASVDKEGKRQAVPKLAKGPTGPGTKRATKSTNSPPLDTRRVLPLTAVREASGNDKLMPAGPIPGTAASGSYNSTYFETPGQSDFGVAVQVWQEPSRRQVNERFKQMKRQYPNASQTQALKPAKAFFAYFGQLQYLSFMVSSKRTIVTITCGESTCSHHMLFELAKAARSSL